MRCMSHFTTRRPSLSGSAALVLLVMSAGIGLAEDAFRRLKGREIRNAFVGKEFTDEVHFVQTFRQDGTREIFSMGKRKSGRWQIAADELCLISDGDEARCYQVWRSGKSVQLRQPDIDITEDGILRMPQRR